MGFNIIGCVGKQGGCRAVETSEIACGLHSFKKCSHDSRDFFLAEIELLFLLKVEVYGHLELLSLDDLEEHIGFKLCLFRTHRIGVPIGTHGDSCRLCFSIILLELLILLLFQSAEARTQYRKLDAVSLDFVPVDIAVVYAYINAFHSSTLLVAITAVRCGKILVEVIGHRVVAVDLITVPFLSGANIDMRVLIGSGDVCNACESDILCFTADHLRADWLPVLTEAADIRSIAERMLTGA